MVEGGGYIHTLFAVLIHLVGKGLQIASVAFSIPKYDTNDTLWLIPFWCMVLGYGYNINEIDGTDEMILK